MAEPTPTLRRRRVLISARKRRREDEHQTGHAADQRGKESHDSYTSAATQEQQRFCVDCKSHTAAAGNGFQKMERQTTGGIILALWWRCPETLIFSEKARGIKLVD